MKPKKYIPVILILLFAAGIFAFKSIGDSSIISYTASPESIQLFWKDSTRNNYGSLGSLKRRLNDNGKQMLFAMNGGMYMQDGVPLGLYIENGKTLRPLNTRNATGNFYLKPNGVFYITKNKKVLPILLKAPLSGMPRNRGLCW